MQGILIDRYHRPSTKAEMVEAIRSGLPMEIDPVQHFGSEYSGPLDDMPPNSRIAFKAPDPYVRTKDDFYGTLIKDAEGNYTIIWTDE